MKVMTVAEAMKKRRLGIQNRKVKAIFLSSGKALTMFTVITGEEDDYTIHQVRSKLFSLENGEWKERGTGVLKLNVRDSDGAGARLGLYISTIYWSVPDPQPSVSVMRRDAVCTILLNIALFYGMACTLAPQDPRYLRFSAIENGSTTHYNLRVSCTFRIPLSSTLTLILPEAGQHPSSSRLTWKDHLQHSPGLNFIVSPPYYLVELRSLYHELLMITVLLVTSLLSLLSDIWNHSTTRTVKPGSGIPLLGLFASIISSHALV